MEVKDYPANNSISKGLTVKSESASNSLDNASTEKKVEKVITSTAKKKKKGFFGKLMGTFVPEDVKDVKSYIFTDVVVPAVKGIISDTIEKLLYGGNSRRSSSDRFASGRVSYRSYYDSGKERGSESRGSISYTYDDIVIPDRGDAQTVVEKMDEMLEQYGYVSVADYYDLVGIVGNYTDNNYGWNDLANLRIDRVREGFLIRLPKASPINRK